MNDNQDLNPEDEQEIRELLASLDAPTLPTVFSERIEYALAVESENREHQRVHPLVSAPPPDELQERRRIMRPGRILGGIAGIAAVGLFAVVGLQTIQTANSDQELVAKSFPVVLTGTTYQTADLDSQIKKQLPQLKQLTSEYSSNSTNSPASSDLATQSTQSQPSSVQSPTDQAQEKQILAKDLDAMANDEIMMETVASNVRNRIPECLDSIDPTDANPIIVDLAKLESEDHQDVEPIAVIALPVDETVGDEDFEFVLVDINCTKESANIHARLMINE